MILGINASRTKSGGAIAHVIGILRSFEFTNSNYKEIHIWSYKELLDRLPKKLWLKKHYIPDANKNILFQLKWELFSLPSELNNFKCDILFNLDAGSLCIKKPYVTLSQDMLSYEKGQMFKYGISISTLRLIILKYVQNRSFKNANGVIFLTSYSASIIKKSCGNIHNYTIIPHGINKIFSSLNIDYKNKIYSINKILKCLYISNIAPYKNQDTVIKAINHLNQSGYNITIDLVGGGDEKFTKKINSLIEASGPNRKKINTHDFLDNNQLPNLYLNSDIFIFASSCENMPVTLLEAMQSGLPIACSDRGPMPEIMKNSAFYFDPDNFLSLVKAIKEIVNNSDIRNKKIKLAKDISNEFSWERCALETFDFINQIYFKNN